MKLHRISLALAASLLVPTAHQAQGQDDVPGEGQSITGATSPASGSVFKPDGPRSPLQFKDSNGAGFEVWIAPFFVLVLLVGVLWFLNRKGYFGKFTNASTGQLKIKEQIMLGNRQFLVVAEYSGREIMLGIGPGFVNHVCDLGHGSIEFETALSGTMDANSKEEEE